MADSLSASSSAWAVTVTVWAVFQFVAVNTRDGGSAVAAPASELATDTVVPVTIPVASTAVPVAAVPAVSGDGKVTVGGEV